MVESNGTIQSILGADLLSDLDLFGLFLTGSCSRSFEMNQFWPVFRTGVGTVWIAYKVQSLGSILSLMIVLINGY